MKLANLVSVNNIITESADLMDYYRMVTPIEAGILKKIDIGDLPENLSDEMSDAFHNLVELKLVTPDGSKLTHMGNDVLVVIADQGSYKLSIARNKRFNIENTVSLDDTDPDNNSDIDDYIEIE